MGLFGFGSPPAPDRVRLARLERKIDLILEHLGLALPEEDELEPVRALVDLGPSHKIAAIKAYREATGAGLREAKEAVEEMERRRLG